ncbi:hypothetical protein ACSQ5K_26700 [Pseudomonas sp. PhalM4]
MNLIDIRPGLLPLSDFLPSGGSSLYSAGHIVSCFYAKDLSVIGFIEDVPLGRSRDAAIALCMYLDKLRGAGLFVDLSESARPGGFRVNLFEVIDGVRTVLIGFGVSAHNGGWNLSITEQLEETAVGVCSFCQSAGL